MHIRSKFDGGKVINRSQSGSWQRRCMGAGLRQNMGKEWGPEIWKQMATTSPNKIYTNTTNHSAKESRRRSKYSRTDDTPAARRAYSRRDNGVSPDEVNEDI